MSIKRMTSVWDSSKAKGSHLLLLLAIADHADDNGYAWPGMASLAKKVRMSRRHVVRMIESIEATGELYVERKGQDVNKYIVKVGLSEAEFALALRTRLRKTDEQVGIILKGGSDNLSPPQDVGVDGRPPQGGGSDNLSPLDHLGSDSGVTTLVTHESHESSYNHHQEKERKNGDFDSQILRVPVYDDGEEIPTSFDPYAPFFVTCMKGVLGHPKNLQGKERERWMQDIQLRAANDLDFKAWCIWQSENNAKGKTLKLFMEWCAKESDFAIWKAGHFLASDDWKDKVSRGMPEKKAKPEKIDKETKAFLEETLEISIFGDGSSNE